MRYFSKKSCNGVFIEISASCFVSDWYIMGVVFSLDGGIVLLWRNLGVESVEVYLSRDVTRVSSRGKYIFLVMELYFFADENMLFLPCRASTVECCLTIVDFV